MCADFNARMLATPAISKCWMSGVVLLALFGVRPTLAANCTAWLSDAEVDYGRLHRGELMELHPGQTLLALETRRLTLSVSCQAPELIKLRFNGVSAGAQLFRLGHQGQFSLRIRDAMFDGTLALLAKEGSNTFERHQTFDGGQVVIAQGSGGLGHAKLFTAQIEVQAQLNEQQTQVLEETLIEGAGTFELITTD